ncbi:MAG: tetratricopeptide repeat protein [Bacteroidetes bacterium]|nr:tetratricopeptide repeat protein [Bacteroidota bacterium]
MANILHKWLFLLILFLPALALKAQAPSGEPVADTVPAYQKLYNKALTFIDSGQYKEALPVLKKVLKENKEFYKAHTKMALIYLNQKDYKEAEKSLKKSEVLMPLDLETQKIKALVFYNTNKFKESKSALDTAIMLARDEKVDDPDLFYYRAQLAFKGKSYKSAMEACEVALEFNPKYIPAIMLKAEIRFTAKEYNYAIKELNEVIKLTSAEKPDYSAYKLRAQCRFETGDYKGCITDWNVYIDGMPGEEEALISRAAALINTNDNSKAIADLDEAIKINKKNPVSYCYRGVAKGGNKVYTEGLADLDYAIKLKFDYGAAYVNRAAIKMALKQKEEACKDLHKADSLGDNLAPNLIEKYCKGSR